ncbi:dTDP-4-dehydrorhamnose reductase [Larsenimonas rhizosphaerae]|uniref:dTDP-4-dehydrorhamnose reductase n=1 Tax=Larsenimonas rhizosphaerae TaxID=2944682 RepID=UPI002034A2CD|nr:dTDP-4-dehydrorhamnose reductase [Larsenimonas rhizosphaerae]MCM2131838.1 dTDP-4-dehydrorhamnose reductase [Larsenimonas rhizosphaerae]
MGQQTVPVKLLLLGANGQVGWELQRSLAPLGEVVACTREQADLSRPESLKALVDAHAPQAIINAAAYTAVDKAEDDEATARLVNAEAVRVLADCANATGAVFVHYSTDYVFDGTYELGYEEDAETGPLSAYGRTKLAGEREITASGCLGYIFRTSWVYAARGGNFAKTMLRLASERDELNVVADQYGAPTSAELIADVTAQVVARALDDRNFARRTSGIYHLAAGGHTTWHGFARFVIQHANALGYETRLSAEEIRPITTAEFPVPARRPAYSLFNTDKLCSTFGLMLPRWQLHAERMMVEYLNK